MHEVFIFWGTMPVYTEEQVTEKIMIIQIGNLWPPKKIYIEKNRETFSLVVRLLTY
jgi:hypothetical protein